MYQTVKSNPSSGLSCALIDQFYILPHLNPLGVNFDIFSLFITRLQDLDEKCYTIFFFCACILMEFILTLLHHKLDYALFTSRGNVQGLYKFVGITYHLPHPFKPPPLSYLQPTT